MFALIVKPTWSCNFDYCNDVYRNGYVHKLFDSAWMHIHIQLHAHINNNMFKYYNNYRKCGFTTLSTIYRLQVSPYLNYYLYTFNACMCASCIYVFLCVTVVSLQKWFFLGLWQLNWQRKSHQSIFTIAGRLGVLIRAELATRNSPSPVSMYNTCEKPLPHHTHKHTV